VSETDAQWLVKLTAGLPGGIGNTGGECGGVTAPLVLLGAITQCGFSTTEGVQRYIDGGGTERCSAIAQSVAHNVLGMVQSVDTAADVRSDTA
jgi:hypothetical protein